MLSNNHVLANSNNAKFGDNIIQPGRADGGVNSRDRIAVLERFVPIQFGSGKVNYADCATGWCWPKLVRRDWVYHVGTAPKYLKCAKAHVEPKVNMIVGKTGQTTNLTKASVTAVDVSINVNFGGGKVAHFRDQFSVRGLGAATFSAGGDSGSLVWTWDSRRNPEGLLFAGGGGTTFCNRISRRIDGMRRPASGAGYPRWVPKSQTGSRSYKEADHDGGDSYNDRDAAQVHVDHRHRPRRPQEPRLRARRPGGR